MGQSQSGTATTSTSTISVQATEKLLDATMILQAIEYLSAVLWRRTRTHHTFTLSGEAFLVLFFRSRTFAKAVDITTTSTIDSKTQTILKSAVQKCATRYNLPPTWLCEHVVSKGEADNEYNVLVTQSLEQNIIVYSSDGLSLLAVDVVYELQHELEQYSKSLTHDSTSNVDLEDTVELLRRLVTVDNRGKPLKQILIESQYAHLTCSNEGWKRLSLAYRQKFGETGMLLKGENTSMKEE